MTPQNKINIEYKNVRCPYCGNDAEWVDNAVIYGKRYGKSYMMWLCRKCWAYVGCHENTKQPLGTLANADLRKKRMEVHDFIDELWMSGRYSRRYVYQQLSDAFGESIHIGESDEKRCDEIIRTAELIFK